MIANQPPAALIQRAALAQRAGRWSEAIAAYEQLLLLQPDLPDSWYNLARLQARVGQYAQALGSYQSALDFGVERPEEVHLNRSVVFADGLHQNDAAARELAAALQCNPRYGLALLNLAALHEYDGRRQEALTCYEQLLEAEPACDEGLTRYAALLGASSPDDPVIARLREALDRPGVTDRDRAGLGFALGKLLDSCRQFDAAFAAFVQANAYSRASLPADVPPYDRDDHARYVDQIIAAFARPLAHPAASSGQPPIFICGMYRSGSTLVEQVLAGHPLVAAGGELNYVPELVRQLLTPFPGRMAHVTTAELSAWAQHYKAVLPPRLVGAARTTDKRPDNFLYIGLIKALFPNARIVHTVRNPLDNGLAVFFQHLDPRLGYALDLGDIGHYHRQYCRLMAHWKTLYGADIFDFDYDLFVEDPRPQAAKLLDFCGLAWDENCLNIDQRHNAVRTASLWQVRQPLYTSSSSATMRTTMR